HDSVDIHRGADDGPVTEHIGVASRCGQPLTWTAEATPRPPWLTFTADGSADCGGQPGQCDGTALDVTLDPTGLAPSASRYTATIVVTSAEAGNTIAIPVRLYVSSAD